MKTVFIILTKELATDEITVLDARDCRHAAERLVEILHASVEPETWGFAIQKVELAIS